jgi:hypothetical protein
MRDSLDAGVGVSSSGSSSLADALALVLGTAAMSNATSPADAAALVMNLTTAVSLTGNAQL